jgi:hypothetical protein
MGQSPAHITVAFRGHDVPVQLANTTCGQAAEVLQQHTDQPLALHTLRLLVPKHAAVQLLQQPDRLLSDTGEDLVLPLCQCGSCCACMQDLMHGTHHSITVPCLCSAPFLVQVSKQAAATLLWAATRQNSG